MLQFFIAELADTGDQKGSNCSMAYTRAHAVHIHIPNQWQKYETAAIEHNNIPGVHEHVQRNLDREQ